jgi:hypothetical protein
MVNLLAPSRQRMGSNFSHLNLNGPTFHTLSLGQNYSRSTEHEDKETLFESSMMSKSILSLLLCFLLLAATTSPTCRAQTLEQLAFENDLGVFLAAVGGAGLIDVVQQEGGKCPPSSPQPM